MAMALLVAIAIAPSVTAQSKSTTAHLEVTVTDHTNAVFPDAQVRVRKPGEHLSKVPVGTNKAGLVSLDLPPGTYDVFAARAGFESWATRVHLQSGSTTILRPSLRLFPHATIIYDTSRVAIPPDVALMCIVTDIAGVPIEAAQVEDQLTDEHGVATIRFPSGNVWVFVATPGYVSWRHEINRSSGSVQTLRVVLEPMAVNED